VDIRRFVLTGSLHNIREMAFRMGRLDHVHIRVPDRAEAAAW